MRPIALLTDFGLADHYVGVLHAVLERDAPGAARINLGHEVPPGDIWVASFMLRCVWPHLPDDCVVMAVVDPGVGSSRRALAVGVGGRLVVAPDNGIAAAVGSAASAAALDWRVMGVAEPSATFHGRDLFAPAAARLAGGAKPTDLGPEIDPAAIAPCLLPEPATIADGVEGTILHVDRFGNLITNVSAADHADTDSAVVRGRAARRVRTYAEARPDEVVLLAGSAGYFELAVNCGSAAEATGLERGDRITITRRQDGKSLER
jgi:S-adenosyl-L-methionine hydrolase (adenosine-forming)